jgi:hypothetical protein
MAEIKFGKYSQAYYGDVVQADVPRSTGLTLVPTNRYSGKPQAQTDLRMYGDKPGSIVNRLYLNGVLANGLINNKLYENGEELSKEQIQAGSNVNYVGIAGELATLGLRTPTGTRGAEFVRNAAAEKKFAEQFRFAARNAVETGQQLGVVSSTVNPSGYALDKDYFTAMANASDEEIIARFGGVNKEGVTGSGFGINALYDPNAFPGIDMPGSGTGKYGGTGPAQYIRGSRAITESDILALAQAVGANVTDRTGAAMQKAAQARLQLQSIFENDPSWLRREQARDAMSYGLPGYPGGPAATTMSTKGATAAGTGTKGGASTGAGASTEADESVNVTGSGTYSSPLKFNNTPYTGNYNGIVYVNGVSTIESDKRDARQSAYDELLVEFNKYGLGSLVTDIKGLIEKDIPRQQFIIELRNTKAYQERFKANAERLKKGLSTLNEATYINNEDAYRNTLRTYGLTQFDNDEYVSQFIANDIRPEELTERVSLAVNRVKMADPAITRTLKDYYGLQDADMVASILDPKTQLPRIQRQIAASEIGVAAGRQGFNIGPTIAEQLAAQGVTQAGAQKGYGTIAEILPTAEKLSDIYGKDLERYGLAEAEQEVFNELASAQRKRKRLVEREIAGFSGQSGVTRGSLGSPTGGQY